MKTVDQLVESLRPHRTAKDKMISYRVTAENKDLLKQVAKNKGMTLQELITNALLMYLTAELEETKKKEQEKS